MLNIGPRKYNAETGEETVPAMILVPQSRDHSPGASHDRD